MKCKPVKDANLGNSPNTYYRDGGDREWCLVYTDTQTPVRDKAGRVRRFSSWVTAEKAAKKV